MPRKIDAKILRTKFNTMIKPMNAANFHRTLVAEGIEIEYQTFMGYLANTKKWQLVDAMVISKRLNIPVESLFELHTKE